MVFLPTLSLRFMLLLVGAPKLISLAHFLTATGTLLGGSLQHLQALAATSHISFRRQNAEGLSVRLFLSKSAVD
jgi:hypothetical protein